MSDLISRLNAIWRIDDHERGCKGREYTCSCGYDNRVSQTAKEASDEINRLRAELAEARTREPENIVRPKPFTPDVVEYNRKFRARARAEIDAGNAIISNQRARISALENICAELAEARNKALEDAAKMADAHIPRVSHDGPDTEEKEAVYMTAGNIAAAIRALKDKP